MALHGTVALIGANGDDENGENAGAAYIFTLIDEEWIFTQKLTAPDGAAGDNYGFSVAIYGEQAIVSAVWDSEKRGSAYVYILLDGVWTIEGKFTAQGGNPDDQFGWSVSIYNNTIAVGAFADDASGLDSGSVYVFMKDARGVWRQQARLTPDDGEENDHFGRSVDVHEDWLIVSAPFDDDVGLEAGSVYIYERYDSEWSLQAKVTPTIEPSDFHEFGFGVGVSGRFFVVSSKSFDENTSTAPGNCYIYETVKPGEPTAAPTSSSRPSIITYPPTTGTGSPSISSMPSESTAPSKSFAPSISMVPSLQPSLKVSTLPSVIPTTPSSLSSSPSNIPTSASTATATSYYPSTSETDVPTSFPTYAEKSIYPSLTPSGYPSLTPTVETDLPTFSKPPQGPPSSTPSSAVPSILSTPSISTWPSTRPSVSAELSTSSPAPTGTSGSNNPTSPIPTSLSPTSSKPSATSTVSVLSLS